MRDAAGEVGVLALQGDFAAHEEALRLFDLPTRQVRAPADLGGIAALVLPGGESTTMLKLLASEGLEAPLRATIASGIPILATCAGLILLAREVTEPEQPGLGVLDITVARNGYGRQIASGTFLLRGTALPSGTHAVFIRAPRITRVGKGVEVLAWRGDDPCLVKFRNVIGACFHPELEPQHPVTAMFANLISMVQATNRS